MTATDTSLAPLQSPLPLSAAGRDMLLRSFVAIGAALAKGSEFGPMLQCLVDEARQILGASVARVRLADAADTALVLAASSGDAPHAPAPTPTIPLSDVGPEAVFRSGAVRVGVLPPPYDHLVSCTLPLAVAGRVRGLISIWRPATEPFSEDDIAVARVFADAASFAITQAHAMTELRAHAARMETLTEVARIISAATDTDALYEEVFEACKRVFGAEHFYVAYQWPDGTLRPVVWSSYGRRLAAVEGQPLPPSLGSVVIAENRAITTADVSAEYAKRGLPTPPLRELGSSDATFKLPWIGVPIRMGERAVGIISTNGRATPYSDEECEVLQAIAAQVGVAARTIELLEAQRQRAARLRTLTEVARAISAATDLHTLYEAVHRECARLFSVESFYIAHISEGTDDIVPDLWYTAGKRLPEMEGATLEGGLSFIVRETRQLFVTDNYIQECVRRGIPIYYPTIPAEPASAWMGAPLLSGQTLLGLIVVNGKASPYTADEREAFVAIANQVSVALRNARLLNERERRAQRIAQFAELSHIISAELEIQPLMGVIARECATFFGLRRVFIGYRSADEEWMQLIAMDGQQSLVPLGDLESFAPLAAYVTRTRAALAEPDYEAACRARGLVAQPPPEVTMPSGWIGVPMFVGGRFVGIITGFLPAEQATDANAQILAILGNQAAVAIENAHLYHGALQLGVIEERNRLAREIHDTIAQGLTATTYQLELADTFLALDPPNVPRVQQKLLRALDLTRANLDEARRSVMDLRAAHPGGVSLVEALTRLAASFQTDAGVQVEVTVPEGFPRLPTQVAAGFYRIAQETLANVAKHAQATCVTITLGVTAGEATLDIADDGVGFDPAVVAVSRTAQGTAGGFGLIGIRERAQLLGGTSEMCSDIGAGTQVTVRVPLGGGQQADGSRQ